MGTPKIKLTLTLYGMNMAVYKLRRVYFYFVIFFSFIIKTDLCMTMSIKILKDVDDSGERISLAVSLSVTVRC